MTEKRATFKKQARKMIFHVYNFMKADAEESNIQLTLKELVQKTAEATKSSESTVRRIIKDAKDDNYSADNFVTPGKKRTGAKRVVRFSLLEQGQIKRMIHNFHVTENETLTMERLRRKLASTMDYKGSESALRRTTVKDLGFRSKKVEGGNNKRLFLETSDVRLQRIEYLQKLRNYRQEGRKLVYIHHVFIEVTPPENKKTVKMYVCVLSASTDNTIILDTVLAFATSRQDYDDHFHHEYKKWITEYLVKNVADNSVVVIGSEKCHEKEFDAIPASCGTRREMMIWLEEKGIEFDGSCLKPQLYALIKKYQALNKEFLIDKLLAEHTHTVLRIPLFHPDLSPLKIAWEDIKSYVKKKEMKLTKENVTEVVKERIEAMSTEFKNLCRQVKDIEQEYRKSDFVIDMLTEDFKVFAGQSSDQDDDDDGDDDEEPDDSEDEDVQVKRERLEEIEVKMERFEEIEVKRERLEDIEVKQEPLE